VGWGPAGGRQGLRGEDASRLHSTEIGSGKDTIGGEGGGQKEQGAGSAPSNFIPWAGEGGGWGGTPGGLPVHHRTGSGSVHHRTGSGSVGHHRRGASITKISDFLSPSFAQARVCIYISTCVCVCVCVCVCCVFKPLTCKIAFQVCA
jgi:hypothetical protein